MHIMVLIIVSLDGAEKLNNYPLLNPILGKCCAHFFFLCVCKIYAGGSSPLQGIHSRVEYTTDMQECPMPSLSETLSCHGYVWRIFCFSWQGLVGGSPPWWVTGGSSPLHSVVLLVSLLPFMPPPVIWARNNGC